MSRKFTVELTEPQAMAILLALFNVLDDPEDSVSIFIHPARVQAAKRAESKIRIALYKLHD